ncbi:glutathione S-transferase family protein [Aquisalimonas lutea]|uniref:glutathione S-transferase family protein n=1 Tax=Aquisalimonas lutea TaxID=1327750 RepID=UPI0025B2E477|nr:glutathione S-transferase family protein [Aquisalimonas lutea]MDN3519424.1 glutathione S-transferase family protein [Aquisalimonas lutea]
MTGELILHTNPQSRGRIARWMLEEIGASYRTEVVDYGATMKSPDYLAINPMGKVPSLRHGDHVVTECAAICAYLADTFPEAGLGPRPEERANYYRWLFFVAGPLEAAVTDSVVLGVEPDAEKQRMVGYGTYATVMETLAGWFRTHAHAAGDRFTAADVYVGAHIAWGLEFGSIEPRPEFEAYALRIREREALQRATELDDQLAAGTTAP